jgi:hypothetical protein
MKRVVLIAVVSCIAFGCGGDDTPTSPTQPASLLSLAGTWSGSFRDQVSGEGTARVSLREESPTALLGTWSATFRNGETYSGIASAYRVQSGFGISLSVVPPPCAPGADGGSGLIAYLLVDLAVTSTQLTAVPSRITCSGFGLGSGSVMLSKQ